MCTPFHILRKPGCFVIEGKAFDINPHRHHVLQLSLSLGGPHILEVGDKSFEGMGSIVAANVSHGLRSEASLLLLLAPESLLAKRVGQRHLQDEPASLLPEGLIMDFWTRRAGTLDWASIEWLLSQLVGEWSWQRQVEPRLQQVLLWFDEVEAKGHWDSLTLEQARQTAHLSTSRFLHLFSEQMGLPWRRYVRWRRLIAAVDHALSGASLTESAHKAGFSDSAHLSRSFREMFGISPSSIVRKMTKREE